MTFFARLALSLMLLAAAHAFAGAAEDETRELETAASNNPRQAIKTAETQLRQAQSSADKAGQLKALRLLVLAHAMLVDYGGVREDAERGMVLARELGNMEALAQFITAKAGFEWRNGRYPEATALFDEAIELAKQSRLDGRLAKIYFYKAVMYNNLGRSSDALALCFKGYTLAEAQHERYWMALTLSVTANVYSRPGASIQDLTKAVDYNKRALELFDLKIHRADVGQLYGNLGLAYFRLKAYAQARQYYEKDLALARELQDSFSTAYSEFRLGRLAIEEHRLGEALAYFDKALPIFKETPGRARMVFSVHLDRADVLSLQGRKKESLDALTDARALLTQLASPQSDIDYYEKAAEIYQRFSNFEKALQQLHALRDADRRLGQAANANVGDELKVRFDVKLKETENALLRSQEKESEARRLVLILALILSLIVLGGVVFYLVYQVRQKRLFVSLAMRDELTGLPNRRSIVEFARLQLHATGRQGGGFCIALIDIDHFKAINDDLGHDTGDAVLIAFSQACQRQLRSSDRLGRFGGEEFLLVMSNSGAEQIPEVFERLRGAVLKLEIAGFSPPRRLTFSMGGTEARGGHDSLDGMIKRADEALYRAKNAGRDRYEIG